MDPPGWRSDAAPSGGLDFVGRPDTHSRGVPVGSLEGVRLKNVGKHPVLFDFL